jgi:hypothetical protein
MPSTGKLLRRAAEPGETVVCALTARLGNEGPLTEREDAEEVGGCVQKISQFCNAMTCNSVLAVMTERSVFANQYTTILPSFTSSLNVRKWEILQAASDKRGWPLYSLQFPLLTKVPVLANKKSSPIQMTKDFIGTSVGLSRLYPLNPLF